MVLARRLFRRAGVGRADAAAVWVAALWVSLPLLLSSTLYIVQRMTLLAAFFSLLAMIAYCRGRDNWLDGRPGGRWLLLAAIAVLLATFSKENGLLAVPMIVLIECAFYRFAATDPRRSQVLRWAHTALVAVPAAAPLLLILLRPEAVVAVTGW